MARRAVARVEVGAGIQLLRRERSCRLRRERAGERARQEAKPRESASGAATSTSPCGSAQRWERKGCRRSPARGKGLVYLRECSARRWGGAWTKGARVTPFVAPGRTQ